MATGAPASVPPAPPAPEGPVSVLPERAEPRPSAGEGWDEQEAVRAAANRELHQDVLEPVVGRLAAIAGTTALVLAAYLGGLAWFVPRGEPPWPRLFPTLVGLLAAAVVLSFATYGITKIKQLRPQ
ncbi:MAG TPA: hypothetical protein VGK73_26990, partial [Polyangiaceae bacterium]